MTFEADVNLLLLLVSKSAMGFFMQSLNFQLCMRIPLVLCQALAFSMRRYFQLRRVRFHFALALGFPIRSVHPYEG